jgi:sucrose-6-phosphate hydrolase SacC (GH32 family)
MNIVLMPGTETNRSISLDANAAEKLSLGISGNSMTVSLLEQTSRKEKLTVYLYVNKLKTIKVESNSTVKTTGVLDTPKLEVFVDSQSKVHLKTNGDIKAHSLNGGEIKIRYLSENLLAKD